MNDRRADLDDAECIYLITNGWRNTGDVTKAGQRYWKAPRGVTSSRGQNIMTQANAVALQKSRDE